MKKNCSSFLKRKKCVIFLFHGVFDQEKFKIINYTNKHISKKRFFLILKQLSRKGKCISMDKVYETIRKKRDFEDFSFAISFDDGFYNNYKVALPILKKFKFPAIFYLTYNFINKKLTSWTDQVEYIVEKSHSGNIQTSFGKLKFSNSKYSKIKFIKKIRKNLKKNKHIEPYEFADTLAKKLKFVGKYKKLNFSIFKKMSWANVKSIHSNKLFIIGGHSKNHNILSHLKSKELISDITFTIREINKKLKSKIKHFSYPEGVKGTYGTREINLLKKNGIKVCPSAEFGINDQMSDLFNLKRITVT